MAFDVFVIPFSLGLTILFVILAYKYTIWYKELNEIQRYKLKRLFISQQFFYAIREIINESLLHKKIFKQNTMLGYMHMSLAFGWFLLILIGNLESRLHSGSDINLFYYPIFFRFFVNERLNIPFSSGFTFLMDLLLLIVITGIAVALTKRFKSAIVGMKKTSKMKLIDKLALTTLWLVFPFRLLAESFTSGKFRTGGFLTGNLGYFFSKYIPTEQLAYPAWWSYSIVLGLFFVSVPFSRYMHIPTEIILIFLRRSGTESTTNYDVVSKIEVNTCSRCGICIDNCQLASAADINKIQPIYFIRSIREKNLQFQVTDNCLICGRCKEVCPVVINTDNLRISQRKIMNNDLKSDFNFLNTSKTRETDIVYFAGCMTHLTPGIKKAMVSILGHVNANYQFLDADGSICCGRPLMLAGREAEAAKLMEVNKNMIESTNSKLLIASCPICYRIFKQDYKLDIEVLHHSEYLLNLVKTGKIQVDKSNLQAVYHDPCELGRGTGVYSQPRELLGSVLELQNIKNEKTKSLCCGGSLGNFQINSTQRNLITNDAINQLTINKPDMIATSCPLCKKTLAVHTTIEVKDLAEIVFNLIKISNKQIILKEHLSI